MKSKKHKKRTARKVKNPETLKEEIGRRFLQFREFIGKSQYEIASELDVHQSTITNIERAHTYPRIGYLQYLKNTYNLNVSWLLFAQGKMLNKHEELRFKIEDFIDRFDVKILDDFLEIIEFPELAFIVIGKINELKVLYIPRLQAIKEAEAAQKSKKRKKGK